MPEPDSLFGELIRNQEMREKLTVIKVGGKIVEEEATLRQLLNDFAAIAGHKVLVHGGGRSATKIAAQLGIESKMVNGRRITDAETLKVVTMVYGGLVNKNIVAPPNSGFSAPNACRTPYLRSRRRPHRNRRRFSVLADCPREPILQACFFFARLFLLLDFSALYSRLFTGHFCRIREIHTRKNTCGKQRRPSWRRTP